MAENHPITRYSRMAAGQRYGHLTAIEHVERRNSGSFWQFSCECGNFTVAHAAAVRKGQTQSCGCLQLTQQGMSKNPLWSRWYGMIERCTNKEASSYQRYGGRGITVCDRWHSFTNFLADMESSFFTGSTLERDDNESGYSPENCRWATTSEQSRNKRSSHNIIIWGQTMTIAEAAERAKLPYYLVSQRIRHGWTPEDAVAIPCNKKRRR